MVKGSGSSGRRSPSSPLRASHGDGRNSVSYSPSRSFYGGASDLERSGRRYSSYSRSRASHSEGGNSVSCSRSPSSHGNGSNSERARVSGREKSPGTHGDGRNSKRARVSKSDKCTETSGNDRISALPNKILVHILSFLTMDEAVATGILSKRWEYLWTEIPNLVSCPNVFSLEVLGCLDTILQLTDTTFQVEANLDFNLREIGSVTSLAYENCQKMVQSLLESLGSVEKLSIGSWFLQVLSTMEKGNLLCPSSPCKSLTLNVSRSIEREDLYGIVCILESLPNLEVLT
ncbi:putative F-box/LRR-repeat protein At3g18150 [Coffea eugenioides]|uniref:putative F-box/LRR-repeat protein At3g18150 n=1 Tax=Coffea eugenioides TaxID=49369 RepID=UPI000F60BE29|nr:putative F-box/LRR-repeat protein At3g18150 [Coffea eugenioides]